MRIQQTKIPAIEIVEREKKKSLQKRRRRVHQQQRVCVCIQTERFWEADMIFLLLLLLVLYAFSISASSLLFFFSPQNVGNLFLFCFIFGRPQWNIILVTLFSKIRNLSHFFFVIFYSIIFLGGCSRWMILVCPVFSSWLPVASQFKQCNRFSLIDVNSVRGHGSVRVTC